MSFDLMPEDYISGLLLSRWPAPVQMHVLMEGGYFLLVDGVRCPLWLAEVIPAGGDRQRGPFLVARGVLYPHRDPEHRVDLLHTAWLTPASEAPAAGDDEERL